MEEPVEIMEREIKRLKRSRIPLVKVRWNSRRGPEFTWEREDSFKQKYPQLFTNRATSSATRSIRHEELVVESHEEWIEIPFDSHLEEKRQHARTLIRAVHLRDFISFLSLDDFGMVMIKEKLEIGDEDVIEKMAIYRWAHACHLMLNLLFWEKSNDEIWTKCTKCQTLKSKSWK
ncbi:hypothetical protein Tco_1500195 [Tanacetum coccineum]